MAVLIIAEIENKEIKLNITAKAVKAAQKLGDITILVMGGVAAAEQAASIKGVNKVLHIDDQFYSSLLAEPVSDLIVSISKDFNHIIAPATSNAKNILPRVAALLDVMIIPDVVEVINQNTFTRPIYAGNAFQTVESRDEVKILTIRTASFDASELNGSAKIEQISSAKNPLKTLFIDEVKLKNDRPDLNAATVVVSGGRGLGSEENFGLIEKLADKLGGAVGASRAAVDSGFAANDLQVGQTGKIVAPNLYIAVGISGAIQHLAGMKDSKLIVAINKDEEAPIFQISDIGLVADLFDVVPELTEKL